MATQTLMNLNKDFSCGEILTETDLDQLVWFINQIINYLNGTVNDYINSGGNQGRDGQDGRDGRDGTNGQNGHTPVITIENGRWYIDGADTGVSATYESGFNYNLEEDEVFIALLGEIDKLKDKVNNLAIGQSSGSSYSLNEIVDDVIDALRDWNWGEVINNQYFDDILKAYLIQIGLISQDSFERNGNGELVLKTNFRLSKILSRLDNIELSLSNASIGTDTQGNQIDIQNLTTRIVQELRDNYGYTEMQAALDQWPSSIKIDGSTINNPTIYSALSKTINSVEKNRAGLQALYQQYAGIISQDSYTASLIEGLANEQMAKTSVSSVFGEYFTAPDGLPVYDTWDDGSPVYETDAYGRAIPYTGIVLKYIQYRDSNGQLTNDPDKAVTTRIVSRPEDASYSVKKVVITDDNGNPVKDGQGNILYDLIELKDNQGNNLRKQQAFKVYYRSTNVANDPRSYSFGRYGQFAGHDYFYFEENFNRLFKPENGEAYNNNQVTNPLYMGNILRYSAAEASNSTVPYIKEGEIKWGTATSGDYNDGHYDSDNRFIGVIFIKNYGPDKIAYHKVRKMRIKSSSGIITEANADRAFATVFAQQGEMYSTIVGMTTQQGAFVNAVANAIVNQTSSGQATTKLIADSSMYLARTQYKYNDTWYDIATSEEEYLLSKGVNLPQVTRTSDIPPNSEIRIKPSGDNIEWVQDTTYVYQGTMHTFQQFKKDCDSGQININNVTRYPLWIRDNDGVIIKVGDDNGSGGTYTLSDIQNADPKIATPKKKLIEQATAGVISTVNLADDYSMSQLFAKIDQNIASISTVVTKRMDSQGNFIQSSEIREENNNNVTYYLYRNESVGSINVDGTLYSSGDLLWITVPYTLLENNSNYSSIFSKVKPIYELESNITLTADQINLISRKGEVYINSLASDRGFINTLTSNIINTGNITANSVYIKSYDNTDPSNVIEYNIALDPNNGYYNYYEVGSIQNDVFTAHPNSRVDVNHIFTSGRGYLAKGTISWEANGDTTFKGMVYSSKVETLSEPIKINNINYNYRVRENVIQPGLGFYQAIGYKVNENDNWTFFGGNNTSYTNLIHINGSGHLATGNIIWDSNGNVNINGEIYVKALREHWSDISLLTTINPSVHGTHFILPNISQGSANSYIVLPSASAYPNLTLVFTHICLSFTRSYYGCCYIRAQSENEIILNVNNDLVSGDEIVVFCGQFKPFKNRIFRLHSVKINSQNDYAWIVEGDVSYWELYDINGNFFANIDVAGNYNSIN